MKVIPVSSPAQVQDKSTPESVRTAKAIAAFNRGSSSYDKTPAQSPVLNQNAVSVEELSAIQAPPKIDSETVLESQVSQDVAAVTEETQVPAPVEPQAPAKPEDPAISRQFAQLARQEKALRAKVQAQDQAFKAREAALAAKEAELASKSNAPDLSAYIDKNRFKSDPLSVLAENNISYDELTQQILSAQPIDPRLQATINQLQSKVEQLTNKLSEGEKSQTQAQKQQYDSAVNQIRLDTKRLVQSDPNFETIKATGSINDVVELITQTYEKDGVLLTVEDAAQQVEDYLVEEATKLARLQKIQKRLQPPKPEGDATLQAKPQQPKPQQPQPMKTLTNANSSSRQLSARERAVLAFKGELK